MQKIPLSLNLQLETKKQYSFFIKNHWAMLSSKNNWENIFSGLTLAREFIKDKMEFFPDEYEESHNFLNLINENYDPHYFSNSTICVSVINKDYKNVFLDYHSPHDFHINRIGIFKAEVLDEILDISMHRLTQLLKSAEIEKHESDTSMGIYKLRAKKLLDFFPLYDFFSLLKENNKDDNLSEVLISFDFINRIPDDEYDF